MYNLRRSRCPTYYFHLEQGCCSLSVPCAMMTLFVVSMRGDTWRGATELNVCRVSSKILARISVNIDLIYLFFRVRRRFTYLSCIFFKMLLGRALPSETNVFSYSCFSEYTYVNIEFIRLDCYATYGPVFFRSDSCRGTNKRYACLFDFHSSESVYASISTRGLAQSLVCVFVGLFVFFFTFPQGNTCRGVNKRDACLF